MKYKILITDINTQKKYIFTVYDSNEKAAVIRLLKNMSLKQIKPDLDHILIKEG